MKVRVTLRSGATVEAHVDRFRVTTHTITGELTGIEWTCNDAVHTTDATADPDHLDLMYVRVNQIDAVVTEG